MASMEYGGSLGVVGLIILVVIIIVIVWAWHHHRELRREWGSDWSQARGSDRHETWCLSNSRDDEADHYVVFWVVVVVIMVGLAGGGLLLWSSQQHKAWKHKMWKKSGGNSRREWGYNKSSMGGL